MPKNSHPAKDEEQKILNRISRIEGQLRGIRRMVESKDQCLDIVTQILAVRSAVSMLGIELVKAGLCCRKGTYEIDEEHLKTLFTLN